MWLRNSQRISATRCKTIIYLSQNYLTLCAYHDVIIIAAAGLLESFEAESNKADLHGHQYITSPKGTGVPSSSQMSVPT